jgi:hypothetical protein
MAKGDDTVRRIYDDSVQWLPWDLVKDASEWDYAVFKFPFVPGFHVCSMEDGWDSEDPDRTQATILSTHKTLAEAMNILRVLLANGGAHYV